MLVYLVIYVVGNLTATLFAGVILADELPATVGDDWRPFLEAFAGVFAFQGVAGTYQLDRLRPRGVDDRRMDKQGTRPSRLICYQQASRT